MAIDLPKLKELASGVFKAQSKGMLRALEPQMKGILAVFVEFGNLLMAAGDRAEMQAYYARIALVFRDWVSGRAGRKPTITEACALYDLLYLLKWRSINEPTDLTSFNADVLAPFVAFVQSSRWEEEPENRTAASGSNPGRIAYIATWTNLSSANACARVTWTTILGHQALRRGGEPVVVYCTLPPEADLIAAAAKAGVRLEKMWQAGGAEAIARGIVRAMENDRIDSLLFDTPDAVTTLLVVKRAAPVQIYLEMGFDAWRAPNIEFCFQSFSVRWQELVATPDRCARLPLIDHIDFLAPERDPAEIDALRRQVFATMPDGGAPDIIYGFVGRMTKVTLPWLKLVERMLTASPRAVCYIGGGGGQSPIVDNFLRASPVATRIVYHPRYIDGHIVGRVIDVFLDTFPFPGSLACLEAMAKGVPVVWMPGGYKDQMAERLELYRDATLRAESEDDFVSLALELIDDDRYATASAQARALAHKFGNGEDNAGQIEQVIRRFLSPAVLPAAALAAT